MADVISKIEDESFLGVPQSRASHGCPFENSRLQSNLMGEQGTVFTDHNIYTHIYRLFNILDYII